MTEYHPSDFILRVAEAMHDADNYFVSYDQARAAANLVLEEAAKVLDNNAESCTNNRMLRDVLEGNAAAIRAMKEAE